jgi:hypothetical protein
MNRVAPNMAKPVMRIAAITVLIAFSGCNPGLTDISPDGVSDGGTSTAGLILNIAGDKNGLYAVGLNSGIWKTEITEGNTFDKWVQLSQSPRYAHCIAIDPNDRNHIAVGDRKGDEITDKRCGLSESFDRGKTFKRLSGLERAGCKNRIVNAVVVTNKSTILTSTPNGIGRKAKTETSFTFDPSLESQSFTSIAAFGDWIVARTSSAIFISNTDGQTWEEHNIQFNFPNQNFTQSDTAGTYSVCIIQTPTHRAQRPSRPQTNNVFVYVPVVRKPNGPCIPPDTGIDPCFPDVPPTNPPTCNYCSFLVFSNQTKQWNFQLIRERGMGTSLGGRVFMKSFFLNNTPLQNGIGGNTNLIYCGSENIFKATSINDDGTAVWENIANADLCGEPKPSGIHADIWDFLLDPSGTHAWVSCDGGVYQIAMDPTQAMLSLSANDKYSNLNSGLHTQHIHEAFVAGGYPGNTIGVEKYAYGSQDNGGWASVTIDGTTNWQKACGGDVNIIKGDEGNPEFVMLALNLRTATLATFDKTPPAGAKPGNITVMCQGGSFSFQFIHTLTSESFYPLLDAVVLTTLPLQYVKDKVCTNVPGDLGNRSGTVILRNRSFAANPDINISLGAGWEVEFDDLPAGPQAFWVAGGHADPTYFLICNQTGVTVLFKRKQSDNSWTKLNMPNGITIVPYNAGAVQHGPVFVNPYNPNVVYVSCTDGIYHSLIDRKTLLFTKDQQLTDLVSHNGNYPLDKTFPGGNGLNVVHSNQSNLNSMYPLSGVAFNRYQPEQVVASSPFTGVFFKDGGDNWKDLSDTLPRPFTPVSSVNINKQGIYVTAEGRGMFKIYQY